MTIGTQDTACRDCRRRGWLLGKLSARLDYQRRNEGRLLDLLALPDEPLIAAIGGRRRKQLREEWERFEGTAPERFEGTAHEHAEGTAHEHAEGTAHEHAEVAGHEHAEVAGHEHAAARPGVRTVCRHRTVYPNSLREHPGAPPMLFVAGGGAGRLAGLLSAPAVAIVGSVRPTDYGMEMARSLARGLSASGVTIVSGLANGIAAAAHDGALESSGATVTVMAGGVDVVAPAGRRGLYARVVERGCAVSERPCGFAIRRWGELARARAIAAIAQLTIVVEAGASPAELMPARVACRLGRTVAAVPGRVTSPASVGTNVLVMAGAPLVRGPTDALEELYRAGSAVAAAGLASAGVHWPEVEALLSREDGGSRVGGLEPRLRTVLEQVGGGRDTPGKLARTGQEQGEAMLALSELELTGLLGRGDGGRYVPRESLAG